MTRVWRWMTYRGNEFIPKTVLPMENMRYVVNHFFRDSGAPDLADAWLRWDEENSSRDDLKNRSQHTDPEDYYTPDMIMRTRKVDPELWKFYC